MNAAEQKAVSPIKVRTGVVIQRYLVPRNHGDVARARGIARIVIERMAVSVRGKEFEAVADALCETGLESAVAGVGGALHQVDAEPLDSEARQSGDQRAGSEWQRRQFLVRVHQTIHSAAKRSDVTNIKKPFIAYLFPNLYVELLHVRCAEIVNVWLNTIG